MLADRHYMRAVPGRSPLSLTVILMISLGAAYVLQSIVGPKLVSWLALTRQGIQSGFLWQLLTFQFLHGSLWHLLGNLLGLWCFGRYVEHLVNKPRFLLAYLGSGAVGGILQGVLMLSFREHFGSLLYGASAGVAGVFTIFALLEANSVVRLNFILPVKAKTLLIVFAGISTLFTLVPVAGDNTAHAAHLGGIIGGWAFVRLGWHIDYRPLPWIDAWNQFRARRQGPVRRQPSQRSAPRQYAPWFDSLAGKKSVSQAESDESFISDQVDPILDKISAHGIHSLTDEERSILERARNRMAKR